MARKIKVIKLLPVFFAVYVFGSGSIIGQPTLKETFKNYFYIGTAVNYFQIMGRDPKTIDIVKKQFNSITPENLLKWERVHPKPDKYNFEPADSFVAFGERNKMFIVGHCLIWHSQTPKWVFEDESGNTVTREVLLQRMKDHIFTVVGRYKGRINGWDVVNEAIDDDGELRKSKWYDIIGEDFIQKAFEYAHEADPSAELYYNDFNEWHPVKVKSIVKMVNNLKSKGVKIDGIGMQGHWGSDYPSKEELETCLKEYSDTGLKIMITELDMDILPNPFNYTGADISKRFELNEETNPYKEGLPDSMQTFLAERYAEIFRSFIKFKDSISRVTFWGVSDLYSWKNNFPIRGRTNYPLLFDRNFNPKPAFDAVIKTVTGN